MQRPLLLKRIGTIKYGLTDRLISTVCLSGSGGIPLVGTFQAQNGFGPERVRCSANQTKAIMRFPIESLERTLGVMEDINTALNELSFSI